MSLLTDLKNVSDSAIEQLSGRFRDLPRPLLAAIGAGDIAVERLATLREQLTGGVSAPSGDDVKAFAADLPGRAQQVAGDVARNLEQFAASAPEKVQKLIDELPAKASELSDSLAPENIRGTVEAYTQFVAMIYGNLAERGGKATEKMRSRAGVPDAAGSAATRSTGAGARATGTRRTRAAGAATAGTAKAGRAGAAKAGAAKGGTAKPGRAGTAKAGTAKAGTAKAGTASTPAAARKGGAKAAGKADDARG